MIAGLLGFLICFAKGTTLYPWDGAAVTAFAAAPDFPYRWLAIAATLAACAAIFAGQPASRVAPVFFIAIGLLSTRFDDRFGDDISTQRSDLERELHVASALVGHAAGPVAIVAHDHNASHIAFMRFKARVYVKLAPAGTIPETELTPFARVVVIGPEKLSSRWHQTFAGQQLSVYEPSVKVP